MPKKFSHASRGDLEWMIGELEAILAECAKKLTAEEMQEILAAVASSTEEPDKRRE